MAIAWFLKPIPTAIDDSGLSGTFLPVLPFFTTDGGSSMGVSNVPYDGGNASYVPVLCTDGGCA